ncbi:hypothetical protein F5Y15DRAFT_312547 [Xylariaceae sp. FL0016]|nr:hypothetical protein F5Y15DRAFT_312547 [Xylariaceae sp. FL0016]
MTTITRQPFAPLDGARLQTLTSLKNTQNAIPTTSPVKRKASDIVDTDDFENVDPVVFSKRSKGSDSFYPTKDSFIKPQTFILTKSASASDVSVAAPPKASLPRPRSLLNPKSPAAKLNTSIARSTPLSAPAGRSPNRGKRSGLLSSRRRTAGSYSRVDPPVFGLSATSASAPFSLDAALKGTIPSYTSRKDVSAKSKASKSEDIISLHESEMKSSWDFEIHEDTPEQEMTNLLQHSTCVLDISSDEESESRLQRERVEGKENVPPVDDVSQTSRPRTARRLQEDEMVIEKERNALGELDPKEYYSEGCDENSVIVVPGDDVEGEAVPEPESKNSFEFAPELKAIEVPAEEVSKSVEELMQKREEPAPAAAVLEPMEGTGESFELWESGSAKDEAEPATVSGC